MIRAGSWVRPANSPAFRVRAEGQIRTRRWDGVTGKAGQRLPAFIGKELMYNMMSRRESLQSFAGMAAAWNLSGAAADTMTARAFDAMGKPASAEYLKSLLLFNVEGRPYELLPQVKADGTITIGLPKQKFEISMLLPVRDFGEVYLYADNVSGSEVLLNYEFARSRAAFVGRYVKAAQTAGVSFSPELTKRLEAGEAALKRASSASEIAARVGYSNESLIETMWAGEMAALERARHRIRRQGSRTGFLFGCNAFDLAKSQEYARQFTELLNYGTLPFYRGRVETTEGNANYSAIDAILEKAAGAKMLFKGHPLTWVHRSSLPGFMKGKSWDEAKASTRDYILRSVGRYRTRVHAWDVINEAHDWANDLNYSQEQLLELTRLASDTTRVADPTAFRVVNNCCVWAEYVATRKTYSGQLDRPSRTPFEYLRALRDAKVDYDCIGLQLYCPARDMLEIERLIERFFVFGKPIHVTEAGIPSVPERFVAASDNPYPINSVWHGSQWSEQIQADWIEQFYTLCFSMPQLQAITWWSFTDPGYIPSSGLLTSDLKVKESYRRLRRLIANWQST
jgi:GH35 family endo-1,4-beta-xylanase